jgi:peptidoglycan/xylan/chitin deacetylase (PgdA/CDA1 family)
VKVPILMYHEVAPGGPPGFAKYTVQPRAFAAQMAYLAMAGYTSVSLDDLLQALIGLRRLPLRAVAITFDDGYLASARYAPPILARRGFRATFFLVAGLVGRTSRWLRESHGFELPLFSWASARSLEDAGHRCESHALQHVHLDGLSTDDCLYELRCSQRVLEEALGHAVRHLAYPFGACGGRVVDLAAEAGYESACTVRIGRVGAADRALELPRIPITGFDSLPDFICRLQTGASLRELANARIARVRKLAGRAGV